MSKVYRTTDSSRPPLPEQFGKGATDRRIRGRRLDVSFPVLASYHGQLIQGFVEAMNMSWSGMLLATNFPLAVGDIVSLEFTLPGENIPIHVSGRVVHKIQETVPEEATQLGIAFKDLEPNVQRMIAGFVLQHLPSE